MFPLFSFFMHTYALALFTPESEKRYFIIGQRYDRLKWFKNINILLFYGRLVVLNYYRYGNDMLRTKQ